MSEAKSAYEAAGVNIDAQDEALGRIKHLVASTATAGVLSETGSFGGLFRPDLSQTSDPVLVASADGVGTKLLVAKMAGDYATVGQDLVNHCVNDILVQGAVPLFFLDYVGTGVLEPAAMEQLVQGVAAGCRENGCALLGGETAEMPGFYQPGDYELVGFVVGMVDRPKLLDGSRIRAGDAIVGLRSSGLHTNGYSLARRILFDVMGLSPDDPIPGIDNRRSVAAHLLDVHRTYLPCIKPLLSDPRLKGLAHITGGGLTDNLPRILPTGLCARVDLSSWQVPPLFQVLQDAGGVERDEMLRVFNMGVGMTLVVEPQALGEVEAVLRESGEDPWVLGRIAESSGEDGVVYEEEGRDGA